MSINPTDTPINPDPEETDALPATRDTTGTPDAATNESAVTPFTSTAKVGTDESEASSPKAASPASATTRSVTARSLILPVIGIAVGLVVAAACGFAVGKVTAPTVGTTAVGKVTVTASELDTVIGTYSSPMASGDITIRDIMESISSPDAYVNNDGEYRMPPVDSMMGLVRTRIISEAATKEGISVTDEDIEAYSHKMLGDEIGIKEAAKNYSMTEDAVKRMMRDNILAERLREKVAGKATKSDIQSPDAPSDDSEEAKKAIMKKYADYIIKLVGDEWDLSTGSWKDEHGAYAQALKNKDFSNDGASYEAAEAAYYVAYSDYSAEQSQIEKKWNAYENDLMKDVIMQLNTASLG